ncbi:MAG: tetratricopeptide repeat protein [Candidatus Eisenbacteria bacterium]|nr:tetratricopeptide repeat protein [Candidatus Eisenbacteria bacterium]
MNRRMLFGSGTARALAGAIFVLLAAVISIAPRTAFAQAAPVAQAQQQYDAGNFADALTTLQNALASGTVTGSDALAARQLLGRCQAKVGDVAAARKTFLQILREDPQYRLDDVTTPPDEIAVFREALRTFEAEQAQAGRRIPASLSGFYGLGSGSNEDFGEYVAVGGGDKKFENKPFFGLGVRFPLAPRWSLDLELQRFRATNEDSVSGSAKATYELTATPMVVSVIYLLKDTGKLRVNAFAGGGPMLNSYAADKFLFFGSIAIKVTDTKVGTYFHGGLEGEYLLHPKLSVTGRALVRSAKATNMYKGSTFSQYGGPVTIGDRDLDFSGFGVTLGLRGYIGY